MFFKLRTVPFRAFLSIFFLVSRTQVGRGLAIDSAVQPTPSMPSVPDQARPRPEEYDKLEPAPAEQISTTEPEPEPIPEPVLEATLEPVHEPVPEPAHESGGVSYSANPAACTEVEGAVELDVSTTRPESYQCPAVPAAYVAIAELVDSQAIRAADFSPDGRFVAVGANSATLRVCVTPMRRDLNGRMAWAREVNPEMEGWPPPLPLTVAWTRKKHHSGSIYCARWNGTGDLIATGSNDKHVHLVQFDRAAGVASADGPVMTIKPRAGTVRDLLFAGSDRNEVVVSAGGGDFSVSIHDVSTGALVGRMGGHTGNINALAAGAGGGSSTDSTVASVSSDGTVRLWDIRAARSAAVFSTNGAGTAVATQSWSLAVGLGDGTVQHLDLRTGTPTHSGKLHGAEVKSLQFPQSSRYHGALRTWSIPTVFPARPFRLSFMLSAEL